MELLILILICCFLPGRESRSVDGKYSSSLMYEYTAHYNSDGSSMSKDQSWLQQCGDSEIKLDASNEQDARKEVQERLSEILQNGGEIKLIESPV